MDFKALMNSSEYDFLRTHERLGDRIMLLGLGGSYAYGTNNEGSDIDFRGVTLMMPSDLLGMTEFDILKSVLHAMEDFNRRYAGNEQNGMRVYIDQSDNPDLDTEIFIDANYRHYPLRDYTDLWGTMRSVIRDYDKIGKRNKKKDDNHLNKHAMHLIRLFMMAVDILEKGEIITHRKDDLPLLLAIRRGEYMQADGTFSPAFYEILEEYERRLDEAAAKTSLPDHPDMDCVEKFVERINRYAVTGEPV